MQPFKHLFQYQRLRLTHAAEDNDLMAPGPKTANSSARWSTDFDITMHPR
jgi:hypothetical protein